MLAVRSATDAHAALLRQAETHAERGERTAAVAAYGRLAELRPRSPAPHLGLAGVYLAWGRVEEALEALAEAEERGAKAVEVARLRAFAHARRAERSVEERVSGWTSAAEHGARAVALGGSDLDLRALVAEAHLASRDWASAAAAYEAMVRVDPSHAVAHEQLGALGLGVDRAARDHLLEAGTDLSHRLLVVLDGPEGAQPARDRHAAAGQVLFQHRAWALAARHLELALEDGGTDGLIRAYLGHALDQMGYRREAQGHLREAVELAPSWVIPRTFLGLHHDRWGSIGAAREAYEKAYDLDPRSAALCLEIGQTWAAEGRYVAAEVWLREAASLDPEAPAVWEALARFYLNHHIVSNDRAVAATERLLSLAPEEAEAHDLRGWAAIQTGGYGAAETHLARALELDPDLAAAYYHLGLLRDAQGREKDAERAFQRAIDLDTEGGLEGLVERSN